MKIKTLGAAMLCSALTFGFASCGNGDAAGKDSDTLVSRPLSDSISRSYGDMVGAYMSTQLTEYVADTGEEYDRDAFFRGLEAVIGKDVPDEYLAGVNAGLRMSQDLQHMKQQGVQINRKALLTAFRTMLDRDSIPMTEADSLNNVYETLMEDVSEAAKQRHLARVAQSPEAVQNRKTAQAIMAKRVAEDPEIKKSESGLYYKIHNPGEEPKVTDRDRTIVNYVGTHLDGKVFDKGEEKTMTPGNGLIPGYAEGLRMIGKGGKIELFVPAELAYGVEGVPQAGIGPDEMLVFIVEVVDIDHGVFPAGE